MKVFARVLALSVVVLSLAASAMAQTPCTTTPWWVNDASNTTNIANCNSGKVGLGGFPVNTGSKVQVIGTGTFGDIDLSVTGRIRTGSGNNNGGIWFDNGSQFLVGQMNASTLGFYANGYRLALTNLGNFGIGNLTPSEKLQVDGGGTGTVTTLLQNYGATDTTYAVASMQFQTRGNVDPIGGGHVAAWRLSVPGNYVGNSGYNANSMEFWEYPSETITSNCCRARFKILSSGTQASAPTWMALDKTGNLFVGLAATATSATAAAKLQVIGDIRFGSNGTNTDLRMYTDAAGSLNGVAYSQINSIEPTTAAGASDIRTALHLKSIVGAKTNYFDLVVDGNINAKYQDLAEFVPAGSDIAAGTVVILDAQNIKHVLASDHSYDTAVAGVISAQPGITLGEGGKDKVKVATTGRVKVKVDATNGPIHVGDLLVTSDKPGVAMKSIPVDLGGVKIHRPGTIIGKAIEPLADGQGEILVLLSLQ